MISDLDVHKLHLCRLFRKCHLSHRKFHSAKTVEGGFFIVHSFFNIVNVTFLDIICVSEFPFCRHLESHSVSIVNFEHVIAGWE